MTEPRPLAIIAALEQEAAEVRRLLADYAGTPLHTRYAAILADTQSALDRARPILARTFGRGGGWAPSEHRVAPAACACPTGCASGGSCCGGGGCHG